ncbi:MAG: hypothetical protein REI64_01955 [Pedobacter sp.]|uniref:hypothetical protein n=1 Tax=Pedobacter sp. TaxID=1411316 RepID=UPI0028098EC8|nr:hypothetical protein [Pedobacter sp.]MDQ8003531.1 hypothetical protein [Pedobacter sp.]
MDKTDKNKQAMDSLLEKSKALRAKSKETETKLNELKAKVDKFIHSDKTESDTEENKV